MLIWTQSLLLPAAACWRSCCLPEARGILQTTARERRSDPALLAYRGKFGEGVAGEMGASTVGDLALFSRQELVYRFGEQRGAFLAALPLAQVRLAAGGVQRGWLEAAILVAGGCSCRF